MRLTRPKELTETLDLLATRDWHVLAGGTDLFPAHVERPFSRPLLDISGIPDLRGVTRTDTGWRIGATATWTDIVRADDLPPAFDALKAAAREVGSIQIQNAATVAGNLCNASPAADGVPPLLILDTVVELASAARGHRTMPLQDFIQGNRQTVLQPDEMMVALHIPAASAAGRSSFVKLGSRRYLVISIAMVAARLADGDAAVAVGSCSVVARRLASLERALIARDTGEPWEKCVEPEHFADLKPIDDVRASAGYRRDAARTCTIRALAEIAS
ncbi:MAG: FAD binding domain-containing protein [Minwuia sp.]|nr:FAD binding domain-containing protein [Minwuia sp.]